MYRMRDTARKPDVPAAVFSPSRSRVTRDDVGKSRAYSPPHTFPASEALVESVVRVHPDWTQERLAEEVGVSHGTVRKWANGSQRIHTDNRVKLEALCGNVTPVLPNSQTAVLQSSTMSLSSTEQRVVDALRRLPADKRMECIERIFAEADAASQPAAALLRGQ